MTQIVVSNRVSLISAQISDFKPWSPRNSGFLQLKIEKVRHLKFYSPCDSIIIAGDELKTKSDESENYVEIMYAAVSYGNKLTSNFYLDKTLRKMETSECIELHLLHP